MCTKLGLERPFDFFEDEYNPYCPVCDSCGETGCCPSSICTQEEGCKYPNTNLVDLKYNYTSLKRLIVVMYQDKERYSDLLGELDKITDEEYVKWYSK